PTETSTLYVSRETDINDLSQDKIVTVEYWYEYVESDETGNSYETIRERHVVNIRIHFESGVPIIGELLPPRTVLPGDVLGLNQPTVTRGAYEILGGGWETFNSLADAISHKNGTPYATNQTPMYWYQNGNYVAYYAKTYLGKTYSNAVQISVANYHDLDKVMQDAEHHMYVDNPRVKRNSKIYIDNRECVSDPEKSELDLFSDFFSLSTGATLTGHGALDEHVKDCQNLDFILYSDVAPKKYTSWTSIGTAEHCFAGWLHGNGYTVSGLDKSLFGKLCGNIYNIGVMGSFTSGGVADSGSGHIENTWVSTTATPNGKPVIGTTTESGLYVYNSYYPEEQNWTDHDAAADNLNIIEKPMEEFINGQVAYLLNSNYLQARYLLFGHKSNAASDDDKVVRPVFFSYPDGTLDEETVEDVTKNKEYQLSYTTNTTEWPWHSGNGFVEEYMGNGDYRYSDGIIPKENDVSYTGTELFVPVFPDDYIYFGQTLSYDLYTNGERGQHDTHPTGIEKYHTTQSGDDVDNSKHLLLSLEPKTANRVFRAPAYFGNGTFGKSVTFNASAAFAGSYTKGGVTYKPHEGLTAIDFTGKGDITDYSGVAPGDERDFKDRSNNYGPLLDYYGLDAFRTSGITKNLLVYAPSAAAFTGNDDGTVKAQAAATKTLGVLNSYFNEPEYEEKEDDATTGMKAVYRAVDVVPEAKQPKGHLVQMSGSFATADSRNYSAQTDHFLVDRQDFNAPISYTFGSEKRMWYQRTPNNYVGAQKGWEAVSLPFSAELVTTPDKGEITHFYSGSQDSYNGTNTKLGHEYWLREFKGGSVSETDRTTFVANMTKPEAGIGDDKEYGNTFLWDYYYNYDSYQDKNTDEYQKTYYKEGHTYSNYAYSVAGKPYIIGLPGSRYYEFDLSGQFVPQNTHLGNIKQLAAQTVIFASNPGIKILVSDDELQQQTVIANGYRFVPSYSNTTLTTAGTGYVLAADGGSFDKNEAGAVSSAFRPYFTAASNGGARATTRSIVFSSDQSELKGVEEHGDPSKEEIGGGLEIYAKKHLVVVTSNLHLPTDVRIVNTAGIALSTFTIEPGETIETRVNISGIYIVQTADGVYTKKLSVK
nr:T9SS type A sorting domain-containing protein [Prevotella sp.]